LREDRKLRVFENRVLRSARGKEAIERPRFRWEDNIKMDLQEIGVGCGDWIESAQDRDSFGHL
jgi:hypothetical protein